MTPREHTAQRNRVAASLRSDDVRETHRTVYPVRGRQTGRETVQARRESMRPMRKARTSGRWT
jgi:hypothetical protein